MSEDRKPSRFQSFLGIKETHAGVLGAADWIKHTVILVLLFVMLGLVALTTIQLVFAFATHIATSVTDGTLTGASLDDSALLDFIGFILTIFIAIELAESIEVYLTENDFHGEIVVLVALIAVSRKVILLEYDKYEPLVYVGIAGIIAALAWAYFMLKKARQADVALAEVEQADALPSTDEG